MHAAAVRPTGVERTFDPGGIIVTKTDLQGRLTYANDVFLRVSALREDEAIGKPHNLIRHPDMPRAVFGLLWERIVAGQEIFAYVVNLAADGAHYWVLAHVTPSLSPAGTVVGYHSNRRVPTRAALDHVQPLYRALVAAERQQGAARDAVVAGRAALDTHLSTAGQDYDEMVWALAGSQGW
ncbi:PAS domain-containing protein [Cellulomonas marina]|uniref:PAS domain S-box-containing protein n=1 Tax=Cellulomonas marina TaxID=988821 RepID=A0A1I1AKE6_9CELL|nr:PAS domain-containing protein [Cellulomonas marina]GIG30171.1 transcriptional regulator [Cellulomonas marina]SFB38484.1 PAS domain S-box-containing protein [Cellulomonas marina]